MWRKRLEQRFSILRAPSPATKCKIAQDSRYARSLPRHATLFSSPGTIANFLIFKHNAVIEDIVCYSLRLRHSLRLWIRVITGHLEGNILESTKLFIIVNKNDNEIFRTLFMVISSSRSVLLIDLGH